MSIKQVRCFADMALNFRVPDAGGDGWTVLVGANGVGKSTVLQSIVLGWLDPRPVTSLVPAPWNLCRDGIDDSEAATIQLTVANGRRSKTSTRTLYPQKERYIDASGSFVGSELLLAFSARRRIARPGELPASDNPELERVRGMFDTDVPLLTSDPFAAFGDKKQRRAFAKVVRDVVTHRVGDERMFPLVDLVELRGKGGVTQNEQLLQQRRFQLRYGSDYSVRVGVDDLSDGYQAMLVLVLEVLAQAALHTGEVPDPAELKAVVLIDEIEAHLHPRWQRTVVPLLRSAFPQCQFIATTHSPLVVGSAMAGEVHVLEIDDASGAVTPTALDERLSMLGADTIYEEVFGVPRAAPPDVVAAERRALAGLAGRVNRPSAEDVDEVETAWGEALQAVDGR